MRSILFLILILLLPPALFAEDSIPVIENPRETPRVTVVEYEEVWRAGADDSEEFLFGVIRDAASDAKRPALGKSMPCVTPYRKAPANMSPAPTVSMAWVGTGAIVWSAVPS